MRSRQINFYLTASDLAQLEVKLRSLTTFELLKDSGNRAAPIRLESMQLDCMGSHSFGIYLIRPGDMESVRFEKISSSRYDVDVDASPVIEFSRCFATAEVLGHGRLFLVSSYYDDNGKLHRKCNEFLKWADSILSCTRRFLKYREGLFYFGEEAAGLRKTGRINFRP
jgi:hypothetical protein